MTRIDRRTVHSQSERPARQSGSSKHADTVLTRIAVWAGLVVLGSRHLGSRFGAFPRHRLSDLGRTTTQQAITSRDVHKVHRIGMAVETIRHSPSTQRRAVKKSRIGMARSAGVIATCFVFGFAGVTAINSDAIHVPGIRTLDAHASRILLSFRSAEASYVPPPPPRTPSKTISTEASQPVQSDRDPPQIDVPGATLPPPPPSARIGPVTHVWQTWNNCGPATVTMALSALGRAESQAAAVNFLKTSKDDKNVGPSELVSYILARGLNAERRVGGDLVTLKRLLAENIPVIVEVGFNPDGKDWMGHYRLLVGYDDATARFTAYDSYLAPGVNVPQPYDKFDGDWRAFNRTFIPIYRSTQAQTVTTIAGSPVDEPQNLRALATANRELAENRNDAFAWFNQGSSLTALGRTAEAIASFDQARTLKLPWRMLWYQFGPFDAYLAEGRLDDVLTLANANLAQTADLEESHFFKGRALQEAGRFAEARASYQRALTANSRFIPAYHYLSTLPK